MEDLANFDYKNTDLNKMSDWELERHKKNMETEFQKNNLKPGDKGFIYDKRIEFTRNGDKMDNSWDEEDPE